MKLEVTDFTAEQLRAIVGLFSPCMDDYLYVCDFKKDSYQISPSAIERFWLETDYFHNVEEELQKFIYPEDTDLLLMELKLLAEGRKNYHNLHYRWLGRDREPIWINCRGRVLTDSDGAPHFLVGCINEIGAKQKADNVSGLLGESSLQMYYDAMDGKFPGGFLLRIGIDDFKGINESQGSEYGDYVLRKTAQCIEEHIQPGQSLFRIVADEFAIVDFLGGTVEEAKQLYREIGISLLSFIEENHYKVVYTVSGGIIDNQSVDNSFENAMKYSEFALSEAKRAGKNSCHVFDMAAYKAYIEKRRLLQILHHAVNNDFKGFEVYFQPLVGSLDGKLFGAEALLRFHMPEGNMISPAEFIPILEESGLIIPVGKWVLRQALAACMEWQKYQPDFMVNINLSYVQVLKSRVLADICEIVEEYGINPECVCIELTESGYLEENIHFNKVWNGLKERGIRLALDDFGTGYSNLHYLCDLKPSCVKIDRSFMVKALNRDYEYQLLKHIVEMSHSLGLNVCIEGIETESDLKKAREASPDYIQGFFFGKPCAKEVFFEKFFA